MRGVVGVVAVAAQVFSEEQLGQLRSFPDIGRDDLIRYFTLTPADVAFVDPGRPSRNNGTVSGATWSFCRSQV